MPRKTNLILRANKKKPPGTQQAKRGVIRGKRPAVSTHGNHFSKRRCDKEDKMTDELRHSDDAQHLSGDRRERRIRVLHRSVFGRTGSAVAFLESGVTGFEPIRKFVPCSSN